MHHAQSRCWPQFPRRPSSSARPMSDPATGETYHIEGSAGFWNTSSQMSIASEGFGILGSTIDFKNDLGLESGSPQGTPRHRPAGPEATSFASR